MTYDITYKVDYLDNSGYRESLRRVFQMDVSNITNVDDLDDESRDEILYDERSISKCLDFVFEKTKSIPAFAELYLIGAGRMLSSDPEIGLAVVFSYDYFALFHLCLCDFFAKPDKNNEMTTNPNYTKLRNKIS